MGSGLLLAAGASGKPSHQEIAAKVRIAIAAEKRALNASETDKPSAKQELEKSLSQLRGALSDLGPGSGGAISDLKQAVMGDEIALQFLGTAGNQGLVRGKINIAIIRKEAALAVLEPPPRSAPPPPLADSPPPDPPKPPAPPPVNPPATGAGTPGAALAQMRLMDGTLNSLISKAKAGRQPATEIFAVLVAKGALIADLPDVCGLRAGAVYLLIEKAEEAFTEAYYRDSDEVAFARDDLALAANELVALESAIIGCPEAKAALEELIERIRDASRFAAKGFHRAVRDLHDKYLPKALAKFPPVYGQLSLWSVYDPLADMDYYLNAAFDFGGQRRVSDLKFARKFKHQLENLVSGVATSAPVTTPPMGTTRSTGSTGTTGQTTR